MIIVLGPPGSGKGTQSELLAEKFGFFQWETSSIVGGVIERAKKGEFVIINGKKYYFEEQGRIRRKGRLWDANFIRFILQRKKLRNWLKKEKEL